MRPERVVGEILNAADPGVQVAGTLPLWHGRREQDSSAPCVPMKSSLTGYDEFDSTIERRDGVTDFKEWKDFLKWNAGGIINLRPAPEDELPALVAAANLQLISHLITSQADQKIAERQRRALADLREDSVAVLGEEYRDQLASSQNRRSFLHKRVPEGLCVAILISGQMDNAFAPYFIKVKTAQLQKAVIEISSDLGVPRSWAESAIDAVRKATPRRGINPLGIVISVLGVGLVAVTGPLAVALAPAGLVGGAAFLAGLAALGPGGIAGGIGVIGAVAAVGGGAAVAGALSVGTAQQVEQRVVTLYANALTKRTLRPGTPVPEFEVMRQMNIEVQNEISKREGIDDSDSPGLKEARNKLKVIQSTLNRMKKEGLTDG